MSAKQLKCCCCPECTVQTLCGCVLKRLCITLDVVDPGTCADPYTPPCCCTGQCIEIQYDVVEKAWIGAFQCGVIEIDFHYYFARDDYGNVIFKLRSTALGLVGDDEHVWQHGEFHCTVDNPANETPLQTSLEVSLVGLNVGCVTATISTRSVFRLKPRCCVTCKCLPECLFADLDACGPGNPGFSHGILCWDDDYQGYFGYVTENNGDRHDVNVKIRPRCLYVETAADADGGHQVEYRDPEFDPYTMCDLPSYGDCETSSPCVVEIEIPDTNYHKWFLESENTQFNLPDKCDGFGKYGTLTVGSLIDNPAIYGGRPTTGFSLRDAPCEQIEEATPDHMCDCKTYTGAIGGALPLEGGSIPLMDATEQLPLLIKGCHDLNCEGCQDIWVQCVKNATLPSGVTAPTDACCGYYFGDGGLGISILIWCDGTAWKAKQYCRTSGGSPVYTLVGDITIVKDCIPGTRPQLSTTLAECCNVCHPCDLCNLPPELNVDLTSNFGQSGSAVMVTDRHRFCKSFITSLGDEIYIEIDLDTCTARVGCNSSPCDNFNCVATTVMTINSCDPIDITVTVSNGIFCSACGMGILSTMTFHIYEP